MPVSKPETTAPRKRGRPRTSSAAQPQSPTAVLTMTPDAKRRWENMASFLQIGIAASVFTKNYADAGAIAMHGPDFTKALAKQADSNERLAKLLDYLGAIGPYSEILGAALPLVLQIMANHERVPAEAVANFGVVPPRMLETKVKLEIKQQEAELMRQLQEQEQEINAMEVFSPPNGRAHVSDPTG